MKKIFLLLFLLSISTAVHAQHKSGSKSKNSKSAKVSVKRANSSKKNNEESHTCNYCGKIFYGKGYYLSYSYNGLEMQRSNNENQELCCSSKCARDIMGF